MQKDMSKKIKISAHREKLNLALHHEFPFLLCLCVFFKLYYKE